MSSDTYGRKRTSSVSHKNVFALVTDNIDVKFFTRRVTHAKTSACIYLYCLSMKPRCVTGLGISLQRWLTCESSRIEKKERKKEQKRH